MKTFGFDAVLWLSFGGPEKPDDVMPFLENVTRGRNVPRERLLDVAEHYAHFGGRSPINEQNRAIITELEKSLAARDINVPIYFGNRNWHPFVEDTLGAMTKDGHKRVLAIATSAFSSYSGCRQYIDDLERARAAVGAQAPLVMKVPPFGRDARFVAAWVERAREKLLPDQHLVFTAHSIPESMAAGCSYAVELAATAAEIAAALGVESSRWSLAYQSRSGPPTVPWLGPDVNDHARDLASKGATSLLFVPLGFISDHVEVLFDLDFETRAVCESLSCAYARVECVGTSPAFVDLMAELCRSAMAPDTDPGRGLCAASCCPRSQR